MGTVLYGVSNWYTGGQQKARAAQLDRARYVFGEGGEDAEDQLTLWACLGACGRPTVLP
jgi:hypothetical protein